MQSFLSRKPDPIYVHCRKRRSPSFGRVSGELVGFLQQNTITYSPLLIKIVIPLWVSLFRDLGWFFHEGKGQEFVRVQRSFVKHNKGECTGDIYSCLWKTHCAILGSMLWNRCVYIMGEKSYLLLKCSTWYEFRFTVICRRETLWTKNIGDETVHRSYLFKFKGFELGFGQFSAQDPRLRSTSGECGGREWSSSIDCWSRKEISGSGCRWWVPALRSSSNLDIQQYICLIIALVLSDLGRDR